MDSLGAIPSTIHQKVKCVWKNKVCNILRESWICLSEASSSASVLEVQLQEDEIGLGGFEFINKIKEEKLREFLPLYFDQYASPLVAGIMKKMGFFPGMGLGKNH